MLWLLIQLQQQQDNNGTILLDGQCNNNNILYFALSGPRSLCAFVCVCVKRKSKQNTAKTLGNTHKTQREGERDGKRERERVIRFAFVLVF